MATASESRVFTSAEAAVAIGIPMWQLFYHLSRQRFPEPRRLGGRRCWTDKDIERAREALGDAKGAGDAAH